MKIKTKSIFIAIILAVIALSLFAVVKNFKNPNVVKNPDSEKLDFYDEDWLDDNCECLEHNRTACRFDGYIYSNGYCTSGNNFTNPIRKCSQYNCSEGIFELN
ncbi:MAG: hypothetical protein AABW50_01685 [Nanoarchaeota archaeon]